MQRRLASLSWSATGLSVVLMLALAPVVVQAQDAPGTTPASGPPKQPPREIDLVSKDGVNLAGTYYPSSRGKDAVPVICLHMSNGNRNDFKSLAEYLQSQGHAVFTLDLRGHGGSTSTADGRKIDAATLPVKQYESMLLDVDAAKRFLLECNNRGELNIEKLCVVGAEMGAALAINWAAYDWAFPDLGGRKQGRDVKGLVLISPEFRSKGMPVTRALGEASVRDRISIYIVMGKADNHFAREADRMFTQLERHRKDRMKTPDQDLFIDRTMDTSLQGTKLLDESSLGLERNIGKFIELRLVNKSFPWSERYLAP